ncbi:MULTISPECIES: PAS domain S-box protein [Nostoc]|uniref:histidine kinase n=1 Tax=Nostoc paludosum FACHB-159 TaxID=2692908 RepID=A0ABR8KED5_9NOSO|nr:MULTISPECIES: PAS domain S-box protein [Nostoc]MBD2680784.1 PAS domain S-box protein [Nostoc sp. FACHB-857]MBD2736538.1 PAS domain S-box protein [Nostoc paludosum FACHB-159]
MNKVSEKFIGSGFSLALLLMSGVGIASYLSIQSLTAEKRWVVHTQQVIESIDHVRIHLGNVERAQSNYIFTENRVYQEIYKKQKQKVYKLLKTIRALNSDNFNQQNRLDTLEPLIAKKFSLLEQSIDLFEQKSLDKATQTAIVSRSIEIGKQIQAITKAMENDERNLLHERTAATDNLFEEVVIVVSLGYVLSVVLLIVVYLSLQKQIQMNKALSQEAIRLEQQAAKAKLADILETITDAFVAVDRDSCYTYINHRAEQIFNRRSADLIGKNIWEVFPETAEYKFYQIYHQALAEQRVIHMEEYYAPFDRWVEYSMYPSAEGISILFQDVTRRKLAEIALEESEKRYRSLVIATSQAVWISNSNGMPKEHSSWMALTGQTDAQVKEWGWLNAIHPEDRELTQLLWTEALKTKNLYFREHRVQVADGSYRFFAARAVPVLDANNEIQEWIGTYTDITERKLAQQALQQVNEELEIKVQERTAELQKLNEDLKRSNQELEQFAYVASHDLQEPLRAVTGYTQLLENEYQSCLDNSAKEYLAYIVDGAKRMQQLIQDLLAYSRVGTRGQEFVLVDCNVALSLALNNLHVAIAESKAIITHDPLPKLLADKTQMVQLFQNLIGNAIKFCRKEPPKIHIGALRRDGEAGGEILTPNSPLATDAINDPGRCLFSPRCSDWRRVCSHSQWLIWVQDNGIGIKSQYLQRIFEVFRRLHTRREFSGTGIGLAICKKIVERHGGCIWAESEPGVGTVFYFTLNAN